MQINLKRVRRLYWPEKLQIRKKRLHRDVSAARRKVHFTPAKRPTECWTMDFISDTLVNQKKIRILAIIDVFTRQIVALAVGERRRSEDVVKVLSYATQKYGTSKRIFCENRLEFAGRLTDMRAYHNIVTLAFSRPGTPTDFTLPANLKRGAPHCLEISSSSWV